MAVNLRILAQKSVISNDSSISIQLTQTIAQIELLNSQVDILESAQNVVKNNQTFKTYYDKKMADGRQHYNALGHCAGKLVRIPYKILTENIAFQLSWHCFINPILF